MTDQSSGKEPPKINLGLTDDDDAVTRPAAKPAAKGETSSVPPPKLKIRSANGDAAKEPDKKPDQPAQASADGEEKPKIKLNFGDAVKDAESAPPPVKESPAKEKEEAASEPAPKEEAVEKKPASEASPEQPQEEADKAPIKLGQPEQEAKKEAAADDKPAEQPAAQKEKSKTIQLDDIQEESLDDLYKAALNATQRVVLDEQEKAATGKVKSESQLLKKAEQAESGKKNTARLDLQEMLTDDERKEMTKHETHHIGESDEKDEAADADRETGQTIAIPSSEEDSKNKTARIDLPRELTSSAAPTQRKTIRIKRPESGGGQRTLSVARPPAGEKKATLKPVSDDVQIDEEDDVHPAFAVLALVAVLVSLVVIYVLVATLTPAVPFPGRLT